MMAFSIATELREFMRTGKRYWLVPLLVLLVLLILLAALNDGGSGAPNLYYRE